MLAPYLQAPTLAMCAAGQVMDVELTVAGGVEVDAVTASRAS